MTTQVLITDRSPFIRDTCRRYLAAHGYDAEVAADGLQCIEHLQTSHPSVLVLDPEILWGGGAGVLSWIHDQAPSQHVRVVLTDGHLQEKYPEALQELIEQRLERPSKLADLPEFVHELQACVSHDAGSVN